MKRDKKERPLVGELDLRTLLGRLEFSEENLEQAVLEQAKLFMVAANYRVLKMRQRQQVEGQLKQQTAALALQYRKKARTKNGKRQLTEGYLSDLLAWSPRLGGLKEKTQRAEQLEEYAKLLLEAFRQRRDALKILATFAYLEDSVRLKQAGMDRIRATREELRERVGGEEEEI